MLPDGQRTQLRYEADAAQKANLSWDTVALHTETPLNDFEKQVPKLFRNRSLLRVYGWLYAIRVSKEYDVVLFRDIKLDPFGPILGLFVRNRITIHHTKELEEMAALGRNSIRSRIRVSLEKYLKPLAMRSAKGLVGVTNEIRDYEVSRFPHLKDSAFVVPNGYSFKNFEVSDSMPSTSEINLIFMCAEFSVWHGLDRLLEATRKSDTSGKMVEIHLVGSLTDEQMKEVSNASTDLIKFSCHGSLSKKELQNLYSNCQLAIGSLALDRNGLTEATTLKTRDYLAAGLPVYATHLDTALPSSFKYFYNDEEGVSLERILRYLESLGHYSKQEVRDTSVEYLDKASIMKKFIEELRERIPA